MKKIKLKSFLLLFLLSLIASCSQNYDAQETATTKEAYTANLTRSSDFNSMATDLEALTKDLEGKYEKLTADQKAEFEKVTLELMAEKDPMKKSQLIKKMGDILNVDLIRSSREFTFRNKFVIQSMNKNLDEGEVSILFQENVSNSQ